MPTLDQGSRTFSRWIQRNLFHGIPSGTGIPPPYSNSQMAKSLTNGKQMPISTAPRPSYSCQLWTKVQGHLVDGFSVIYFMEFPQELAFHLHILTPKWRNH